MLFLPYSRELHSVKITQGVGEGSHASGVDYTGIDFSLNKDDLVLSIATGTIVSVYNEAEDYSSQFTLKKAINGEFEFREDAVDSYGIGNLGNFVTVLYTVNTDDGDFTFYTTYAHLSQDSMINQDTGEIWSVGETVATGDVLGTLGWTGAIFGDHLHIQVGMDTISEDEYEYANGSEDLEGNTELIAALTFDYGGKGDSYEDLSGAHKSENVAEGSEAPSGNVLVGDASSNVLVGGDGKDIIFGRAGDDRLEGGARKDELYGEDGNDLLIGGPGADVLDGGSEVPQQGNPGANDRVAYWNSDGPVTVDLSNGTASGADAQGDELIDIESIFGSNFGDRLTGDNGDNLLFGLDGDDLIAGLDGDDYIEGGVGADNMDGGDGSDFLSYSDSTAGVGVTVNLSTGFASGGDATGDVFTNFEHLNGTSYDDNLTGDNGFNHMNGQPGDDVLTGLGGNDFYFFENGDGDDIITDFDGGAGPSDSLGLRGYGFLSFEDVLDASTNDGANMVIQLSFSDSLTLWGVNKEDLVADDIVLF